MGSQQAVKDVCYLVLQKSGIVKMAKKPPSLLGHQVAVKLVVQMPDSHFADRFVQASINVPEGAVIHPQVHITAEEGEDDGNS